MRLIDADKLIETIKNDLNRYNGMNLNLCVGTLHRVILQINEQPTVDAKPIKYAEWKHGGNGIFDKCTACDEEIYLAIPMSYCPNCGAKLEVSDDK